MALAKTKKKKFERKLFLDPEFKPLKNFHKERITKEQINNLNKLLTHDHEIYISSTLNEEKTTLLIGVDEVGRGPLAGPLCTAAYSAGIFTDGFDELIADIKRASQLISEGLLETNIKDSYYAETIVNDNLSSASFDNLEILFDLIRLEDSKRVPHSKREKLCAALKNLPIYSGSEHLFYSTHLEPAHRIDESGIVSCIWNSMASNIASILLEHYSLYAEWPDELIVLVDGPKPINNLINLLQQHLETRSVFGLELVELSWENSLFNNLPPDFNGIFVKQKPIIKGDSLSASIAAASNIAKLKRDEYMQEINEKYSHYDFTHNVGYGTRKHILAIKEHGLSPEHRKSYCRSL